MTLSALRILRRCARAFAAFAALSAGAAAQEPVDLELVLAVDVSSSVDDDEYFLQVYGLAQAFRHPDVVAAIRNTGAGGVAVSLLQWSDSSKHAVAVDWVTVHDDASAAVFAHQVLSAPRMIVGGQTSISGAIRVAMRELANNAYEGRRQTIDLSADGRSNPGAPPERRAQRRWSGCSPRAAAHRFPRSTRISIRTPGVRRHDPRTAAST